MDLYYLIYSSTPVTVLNDLENEKLLATSRTENQAHQVTGMLLCFPRMYVQLIEGSEDEVRQLYKNIQCDTRHYNLTVLQEGTIQKRFFPDWTMGFERRNETDIYRNGSFDVTDTLALSLFNILDEGMG